MKNPTMAVALKAAGRDTASDRLYVVAQECLAKQDNEVVGPVIANFSELVHADIELLVALIGSGAIQAAVVGKLRSVAADMNRTSGSGGQDRRDAQPVRAPASPAPNGTGEGRGYDGAHELSAPPAPVDKTDDRGHLPADTQRRDALPSIAKGADQSFVDAQTVPVRPSREPTSVQRKAEAKVAELVATSVMDTFKITERQGTRTAIGDVPATEKAWLRIAARTGKGAWVSGRESEFATIMAAHMTKQVYIPPGSKTRDVVNVDMAEAAIAESAKIAGAQRRITSIVQEVAHNA